MIQQICIDPHCRCVEHEFPCFKCDNRAEFEAWFGNGLIKRLPACRVHIYESRADKAEIDKALGLDRCAGGGR